MAETPPAAEDTDRAVAAGTPRWVKVFAAVAALVVVLIAVLLIAGRGGHGPGRHGPLGAGADTGRLATEGTAS